MKKVMLLTFIFLFNYIFPAANALAQPEIGNALFNDPALEQSDGSRYVLLMMRGRGIQDTRVPALVLDSFQGIVWTCKNLEEIRPSWTKTDLGKNQNKSLSRKKYIARILEWQESNLRVPAIVLDIEEGIAWTCSDIINTGNTWVEMNFSTASQKEIRGGESSRY